MKNLIEQLEELKHVKPRKDWVETQRDILLSQITKQSSTRHQPFLVNGWYLFKSMLPGSLLRFTARPVGVVTVIALFIFSSGILGVNASRGSLPGDFLYSVKLTSEKMQVGLTVGEEKQAELHVRFAEERVDEIEQVSKNETEPTEKKNKIRVAVDGLKVEMQKAQANLDNVKQEPQQAQKVVDSVKKVDEKTAEISAKLDQRKEELKDDVEITESLNEAEEVIADTAVKAVEVIVDKHEKGEVELSDEEIIETIEKIGKNIGKVEEKVKETAEQVDVVADRVAVDEIANDVAKEEEDAAEEAAAEEAGTNSSETTEEGEEKEVAVDENTVNEDKVEELKDRPSEAELLLEEARDFLKHGDLKSALQKMKQSAALAKQTQVEVKTLSESIPEEEQVVEVSPEDKVEESVEASADESVEISDTVDEGSLQE